MEEGKVSQQSSSQGSSQISPRVFIFILVGIFIFGLIVFGYTLTVGNTFVEEKIESMPISIPRPLFLSLESPSDGTLVIDNKLVVKGRTLPNTNVTFFTESDENSVESDLNGNFEGTVTLSGGINTLTVTAFGENGDERTKTIDVVYDQG